MKQNIKSQTGIIITLVILVLIVIAGVVIYMNYGKMGNATSGTPGTGSNSQTTSGASGTSGEDYSVTISNFAFNPSALTIKKGDRVVWTNMDAVPHTIVSDTGSELNSNSIKNKGTFSYTFDEAGTFNYYCSIHPSMKGKIIVQ